MNKWVAYIKFVQSWLTEKVTPLVDPHLPSPMVYDIRGLDVNEWWSSNVRSSTRIMKHTILQPSCLISDLHF